MTSATDQRESIMTKIMNLLELANNPGATEHERDLAAEMAQKLMDKNMIDRMEAERHAKERGEKNRQRKPEASSWDIHTDAGNSPKDRTTFTYDIVELAAMVLRHCNIRVHPHMDYVFLDGHTEDRPARDWSKRRLSFVGFPEDIMYAERIWFNVFKTFVMNVNPSWDMKLSLGENCYNLQQAGLKWEAIWKIAWEHQQTARETNPRFTYLTSTGRPREIPPYRGKKMPPLKAAVKDHMENVLGKEYQPHTQRHEAYRTSFVRSYSSSLRQRLDKIRRDASVKRGEAEDVDQNQYAVAVRDTKEAVDDEFYRVYPHLHPDAKKRAEEERTWSEWLEAERIWNGMNEAERMEAIQDLIDEAARQEKARQRAERSVRRNYNALRNSSRNNIDETAWRRGKTAADSVNLRADTEVKQEKKELR